MIFLRISASAAFLSVALMASPIMAAEDSSFSGEQIEFFEKEIRPLLSERCLDCHTGAKAKLGLQLHSRAGWLKGSDYRAVVNLEKPAESILIRAVKHTGEKGIPSMPEKGARLEAEEVAKLERWIGMGLPWPKGSEDESAGKDPKDHWSFQPVKPVELPEGVGNPIDYFIGKAQKEAGVESAPKADRYTLYRRLNFDLLGLPPKYEDLQKFINDPRPDKEVWPELINHMLGSPHYGERWARHWMDVARYSDTKGYEAGGRERRFVYSYTYRDWLIHSFNDDMPFDQFVQYQLAADKVVDWNTADKKHLAAMGFLSLSKNGKQELVLDDRMDTTFRGLMALTVSCARCHDHKFDPISTEEYYSIYGIFLNSMEEKQPEIGEEKSGPKYEAYQKQLAEKQKVVDDFLEPKLEKLAKEYPDLANRKFQLIAKLERVDRRKMENLQKVVDKFVADQGMEADKALVLTDRSSMINQHVFIRGNPSRRGDLVDRKFLEVASLKEPTPYQEGSGRLELAKDIASAGNPLTARTIVNRVWMWHFGEGIVRTVSDFGIQGESPDHPELLDWLANWFVENGWSIKKLHQLILTSDTWQQASSSGHHAEFMRIDPDNRLLWRFDRQRLDFEQMRDGMLDVAQNLSNEMYGRAVEIFTEPYPNRRSVYAFIDRQNLDPIFRNFDFSNPQESTGKRPNTTIPMQALFTLNSEFVQEQANILGDRSQKEKDPIAYLHHAVFASQPSESDRLLADSFITSFASERALMPKPQTSTEWSYGYGSVDEKTGKVTFTPYPYWTGEAWQIAEEKPLKNNPLSYLYAEEGKTHPGYTDNESAIYQWRAPTDMRIRIKGFIERPNVNKGNGVRVKVATTGNGIVKDQVMDPSLAKMNVAIDELRVAKGDLVYFLVDPHEKNSSFDSVTWSPQILDLDGVWPIWDLAASFSGPAKPADAWDAYAHALLNTNRFLFID